MADEDPTCTSDNAEKSVANSIDQSASSSQAAGGLPLETSCRRRISLRPRTIASIQADTDKRCKKNMKPEKRRTTECLETIFEEPVANKNGELLLTGKKVKRSITFSAVNDEKISKGKLKKRRDRIKKKLGNNLKKIKKLNKNKSMNMIDIRCKLNLLDIDESM